MKFQNLRFLKADAILTEYKQKVYSFKVYRVGSYFDIGAQREESMREINSMISDYGVGLNVIIPGFAALVAPLNKLRLIALSPTIFEF